MRNNRRRMGVWTEFISLFFMLYIIDLTELMTLEPSFDTPMANVTVKEMATAILPCSVKFIGKHQVVWTDQLSTLLTFEDRRIIDDERLSVERPFIKDWNLHIREVKHKDQGLYNCQINTNPVKIKTVYLRVQVPAKILNNASTDAIIAREGATVTIVCNASGIPPPTITWHRISRSDKVEDKKTIGSTGEILIIYNVSRHCGGIYECVASNDVPPAVNKLIRVNVEFPPEIYLPNSELGHDVGKETVLECSITANPQATAYWKRNGTELKTTSGKFRIEPYTDDGAQTMILSLRIMVIDKEDFGIYSCEASNKLGSAAEQMTFYELSERRRQLFGTTTVTTTPRMTTAVPIRRLETLAPKHHHLVYPDPPASSHVVKDKHQTYGQHNGKKTDFSNSRSDSGCSDVAPIGIHYVIATVVCLVLQTVSLKGSLYSPPQRS